MNINDGWDGCRAKRRRFREDGRQVRRVRPADDDKNPRKPRTGRSGLGTNRDQGTSIKAAACTRTAIGSNWRADSCRAENAGGRGCCRARRFFSSPTLCRHGEVCLLCLKRLCRCVFYLKKFSCESTIADWRQAWIDRDFFERIKSCRCATPAGLDRKCGINGRAFPKASLDADCSEWYSLPIRVMAPSIRAIDFTRCLSSGSRARPRD